MADYQNILGYCGEMISSIEVLINLVRVALDLKRGPEMPQDVDWKEVVDLAVEQGLAALASDGLQVLYEGSPELLSSFYCPTNKELRYDLFGNSLSYEVKYEQHRGYIRELAALFGKSGIRMMIIKGQGLARYYPIPSHRASGDIDVYLYGKGAIADKLVKDVTGASVKQNEDKHSSFRYHDVTVENHATFVNIIEYPCSVDVECFLEQNALEAHAEDIDGVKVYYPTIMMDAVFIPCHIAAHFMYGSVSLKQLVDWALFVSRYGRSIDWAEVFRLCETKGCSRFLFALNGIVIDHFGVPCDVFPSWEHDVALEERVWKEITDSCRVGYTGSGSILKKAGRFLLSKWKFNIVYRENFYYTFFKHSWTSFRGRYLPGSRSVWDKK